jgi:hypothetical protein
MSFTWCPKCDRRGLGLTWGDLIVPPDIVPLRNDWRRMAQYCNRCRAALNDRELAFIATS